jgi:hypothetical protein
MNQREMFQILSLLEKKPWKISKIYLKREAKIRITKKTLSCKEFKNISLKVFRLDLSQLRISTGKTT